MASAARSSVVGGLAPGQAQVLLERGVEDVRVLGHQPDTCRYRPRRAVDLDTVELDRARVVGQETQQHICQRRLAGTARADDRDPAARSEVEVDAVERAWCPAPVAAAAARARAVDTGADAGVRGCAGSCTTGRRRTPRSTRAAERRTRCSVWVAPGKPRDELERDQRNQRRSPPAARRPSLPAHRRDTDEQRSPHRQAARSARQALADARRARARSAICVSSASAASAL